MTLLLIFVSAAFAITALYFALAPFLASREEQARAELIDEELKQVEQLVARKSMLLQSLRELEFEFETAKMASEDYERFRTSLERQAIGVMRELDRIHGGRDWEQKIDAELEARFVERGLALPDQADDSQKDESDGNVIEEEVQEVPKVEEVEKIDEIDESAEELAPAPVENEEQLECTDCGADLDSDDVFCSKCGTPTNFEDSTTEAAG